MRTAKNSWLRTSTLLLLSLGIAYGAQSFTEKEAVKGENKVLPTVIDPIWYNNELQDSDPTNPANYELSPKFECGTRTEEICSISAPDDGSGLPDMSHEVSPGVTVQDQIEDATSTSTPTTNSTVKSLRSFQ